MTTGALPLISLSPLLLDQKFPKERPALKKMAASLVSIQTVLEQGEAAIVNTPIFSEFIVDVGWDQTNELDLLNTIHRYLSSLLLTRAQSIVLAKTENAVGWTLHPLPTGAPSNDHTMIWQEEMGKLLCLHDQIAPHGEFFVGVACHDDFETICASGYITDGRAFPLVSRKTLASLGDGFKWEVDTNLHNRNLPFVCASRNVCLLGGIKRKQGATSHIPVDFPNGNRPWVLDEHEDPIKDAFIKELMPLTNKPFFYIKHVLLHGEIPSRRCRLQTEE